MNSVDGELSQWGVKGLFGVWMRRGLDDLLVVVGILFRVPAQCIWGASLFVGERVVSRGSGSFVYFGRDQREAKRGKWRSGIIRCPIPRHLFKTEFGHDEHGYLHWKRKTTIGKPT